MNGLRSLLQDVRYAARSLRASPLFTLTAVLTLAIGIGATTAIFSSVNAILLRPLPFPHAEQLVDVRSRFLDGRITTGLLASVEIVGLQSVHGPMTGVAGWFPNPFETTLIREDGTPVEVLMDGVTEGFFDVLGLPLAMGQDFTHQDFLPSGENAPVSLIISHRLWSEMFGRDPAIVGRTVHIVEFSTATTIVGVAAPQMDLPAGTDFWLPMRIRPNDISHIFAGVVRLRSTSRIEALRSAGAAAMATLGRTNPTDVGREFVMQPLLDSIVGVLGPTLLIVLGATALLLLLACVNVTNLLLARGTARTRELAMRAALGASRGRIIRQMLTEALVLAGAGALFGLVLAYSGVRGLLFLGASKLPRLATVPFDAHVLLFAVVVLVFTALAMGVAPAWQLARVDIRTLLNEGGRSASQGRRASRSMSALIVGEIALAIILAAGAGWLVQSFARLQSVDPGFTPAGRLVVDVKAGRRLPAAQVHVWWDTMLEHVRDIPGVASAGSGNTFPFRADRDSTADVGVQGEVFDPSHTTAAHWHMITPDFFNAMGIKILAGRDFNADDRLGTLPVTIVNQAFVRDFLKGRNPLSTQIVFGQLIPDPKHPYTIVGVVDDVRYGSLGEEPSACYYLAEGQSPYVFLQQPVVITSRTGDPRSLVPAIRAALTAFDPQIVLTVSSAPDIVAATLSRQRLGMTLMLVFGALALLLSAIGIYGVIAYASTQRRTELATRIALGASSGQVFWLVMKGGQRLALLGIAIGLGGAYLLGRIVASSVYAMRPSDPVILIAAAALVGGITFVATMIPAIWSSRLNPSRALRSE